MKCRFCHKEIQLPFKCDFCGGLFCSEHRLPENHGCSEAPPRTPLGSWETKKMLKHVKEINEKEKAIMISEGEFHFIKKEIPLVDTRELMSNHKKKEPKFSFFKRKKKALRRE